MVIRHRVRASVFVCYIQGSGTIFNGPNHIAPPPHVISLAYNCKDGPPAPLREETKRPPVVGHPVGYWRSVGWLWRTNGPHKLSRPLCIQGRGYLVLPVSWSAQAFAPSSLPAMPPSMHQMKPNSTKAQQNKLGFGGTADDAMLPFQKWLFAERQQSRVVRGCSEITKPSHSQSVEAPSGDTSRCMCVTCMQSHKFAWRVARRQLLVVFCRSTVAGLGFTNAPGPLPAPPRSPPRSSLTTNSHSHTTTKGWADGRLGL